MKKLIAKNDLITIYIERNNGDDRIVFYDTDGKFLVDWFTECWDNEHDGFIEAVKTLLMSEKEMINYFADFCGYTVENYITPTFDEEKTMRDKYEADVINRIGNSYICFNLT